MYTINIFNIKVKLLTEIILQYSTVLTFYFCFYLASLKLQLVKATSTVYGPIDFKSQCTVT